MIIRTEPWVPAEWDAVARKVIEQWKLLIPGWVEQINISSHEQGSYAAEITVADDYRRLELCFGTQWASSFTTNNPEHILLHELCHIFTTPIAYQSREILGIALGQESKEYLVARHAITHALEQCTEDLCCALLRLKT